MARRRPGVVPAVVYRVGMGGGWEGGEGVRHLAASGTHFVVADQPPRTELVVHCQQRVVPLGGEYARRLEATKNSSAGYDECQERRRCRARRGKIIHAGLHKACRTVARSQGMDGAGSRPVDDNGRNLALGVALGVALCRYCRCWRKSRHTGRGQWRHSVHVMPLGTNPKFERILNCRRGCSLAPAWGS